MNPSSRNPRESSFPPDRDLSGLWTFTRNPRFQYAVAVAAVVVATYARMQLDPIVGNKNVFVPYLCGVILTALVAGPVPTLVMVFLSALAADYFFLAPRYSFVVQRAEDQVTLAVFVLIGVCTAALSWQIRRVNDRAMRLQLQLQKEQAARESERRFRELADAMPQIVWTADANGRVEYYNDRWSEYTGLPKQGGRSKDWIHVLHPDDVETCRQTWWNSVRTGQTYQIEYRFRDRNSGDYRWHLGRAIPVRDPRDRIVGWYGTCTDIDDQKRLADAKSREQAEEIETLMEIVPVPIWFARDPECLQITSNSAGNELTRVPQTMDHAVAASNGHGQTSYRTFLDGTEILAQDLPMQRAAATGQPVRNAEFDLVFDDGSVRSLYGFAAPLFNQQDGVRGCIGAFIDITQHKLTENRLRAALSDRETLLKEVHHRVKNNLAITISLLNFQIREARDAELIETLRDAQNRVRSMSMIHELLYRTESLAEVELPEYVEQLTLQLLTSYGVAESVRADIVVTPIKLLLETAIPFGLILNELVSNACKHAYPRPRSGPLMILVARPSPDSLELVVADEGVGIPETVDPFSTRSLGLRLVRDLVQQLGGTLEIVRTPGTAFHVRVPFSEEGPS